ncbi:MAG: Coenzyme F420 hydrogenase/dehydrogenase, beta subunit C-terminal domain [Acholeplasmatales bacterium]|nr:Coenzyme F420 hydrogenase/dehydrogenase, beta subunit C-terminal domain [Acholeplasmatales bacterium]
MYEDFKEHCIAAYGGYLKDNNELLSCTSGGIATAISVKFIEDGGYVAGVKYTQDFKNAEYLLTNKKEELELFKGSKYIDAQVGDTFAKVKELLDANEKVLFIGLPCKVGALNFYLKKEYENLLTCELVCHGPTLSQVHTEYIEYLEKKFNSKIVDFSVRRKKDSWLPTYLYAKFENGKEFIKEYYKTEYGIAFSKISLERCYNCKFKGNNRTGDIQIGDFWGYDKSREYYNNNGTSCILVHTEKGNNYLKSNELLALYPVTFEEIVKANQLIIRTKPKGPKVDKFKSNLESKGLFYAVKKSMGLKGKLKKLCPNFVKNIIKEILRRG